MKKLASSLILALVLLISVTVAAQEQPQKTSPELRPKDQREQAPELPNFRTDPYIKEDQEYRYKPMLHKEWELLKTQIFVNQTDSDDQIALFFDQNDKLIYVEWALSDGPSIVLARGYVPKDEKFIFERQELQKIY